jgi:hypothetical protein
MEMAVTTRALDKVENATSNISETLKTVICKSDFFKNDLIVTLSCLGTNVAATQCATLKHKMKNKHKILFSFSVLKSQYVWYSL